MGFYVKLITCCNFIDYIICAENCKTSFTINQHIKSLKFTLIILLNYYIGYLNE